MLFLLAPFIIYLLILLFFCITNLIFKSSRLTGNPNVGISVIIAIRNGEKSLPNLISDLTNQNYLGKLEFILVGLLFLTKFKILLFCKIVKSGVVFTG